MFRPFRHIRNVTPEFLSWDFAARRVAVGRPPAVPGFQANGGAALRRQNPRRRRNRNSVNDTHGTQTLTSPAHPCGAVSRGETESQGRLPQGRATSSTDPNSFMRRAYAEAQKARKLYPNDPSAANRHFHGFLAQRLPEHQRKRFLRDAKRMDEEHRRAAASVREHLGDQASGAEYVEALSAEMDRRQGLRRARKRLAREVLTAATEPRQRPAAILVASSGGGRHCRASGSKPTRTRGSRRTSTRSSARSGDSGPSSEGGGDGPPPPEAQSALDRCRKASPAGVVA